MGLLRPAALDGQRLLLSSCHILLVIGDLIAHGLALPFGTRSRSESKGFWRSHPDDPGPCLSRQVDRVDVGDLAQPVGSVPPRAGPPDTEAGGESSRKRGLEGCSSSSAVFQLPSCAHRHTQVLQDPTEKNSLLKPNNSISSLSAFMWGVSTWVLGRLGGGKGEGRRELARPAHPQAACAQRLGAGRMGGRGPRDGNSPGHEWGRCSIHKCRVLLHPHRHWRRLCQESPARWSCSSLCQQIPLNSLLTLVWAPLTKLSRKPCWNHCLGCGGPGPSEQAAMLTAALAGTGGQETSAASPVSAPYEFVLLKWTELMKVEWIFLSSHNPPPHPGSELLSLSA